MENTLKTGQVTTHFKVAEKPSLSTNPVASAPIPVFVTERCKTWVEEWIVEKAA